MHLRSRQSWGPVQRAAIIPGDHLSDREEGVLKDETDNVPRFFILYYQLNGDSASETLTVDDDFVIFDFVRLSDVVESSLRVNHETFLVGRPA